jgi:hypothetical protein
MKMTNDPTQFRHLDRATAAALLTRRRRRPIE